MGGIRRHKKRQQKKREGNNGDSRNGGQQYHTRPGGYKDIIRENKNFVDFYRAQKVCASEEELQEMIKAFQTDLPASFRVTGFRSQALAVRNLIESKYFKELSEVKEVEQEEGQEPVPVCKPKCLEWYPDRMAWQLNLTRKAIRRVESYFKLHNFLVSETESGNISRQETVSMIPPRVLGVEPHHKVLDMCAAPGSKTAQLIEALHAVEGVVPEGVVVANDADNSRCYMLVHQAKRLQSPCVIITNHDASIMPNVHLAGKEADAGPPTVMKFDRVLCDVPCAGDGTLRKNADIWPKWNPANSCNLHGIQYRIAKRGLELLAVGGDLCYSTCSLSPIEDEAVLARLLKECGDTVELVDVSDRVPGLKYKPGLLSWQVADKKNTLFEKFEDVPEALTNMVRPSMFPGTEEEMRALGLEKCLRVLPHQQDTGGFFVALLRKKALCPWESEKRFEKSQEKKEETDAKEENGGEKEKKDTAEPGQKRDSSSREYGGNPAKKPRYTGYKEDPFMYFGEREEALFAEVKDYYELNLERDQFLTRCSDPSKRSNLYFTSKLVRSIVEGNEDRIKIINTGVKAFAKAENKGAPIPYRLAQEGSVMTIPFLRKRILRPTREDLITMLQINDSEKPTGHAELAHETRQQVANVGTGSVALVYEEKDDAGETKLKLELVGWKGATSLRAYVPKNERIHYLRLLGGDTSKYEKNKFEMRRENEAARKEAEEALKKKEEEEGKKEGDDEAVKMEEEGNGNDAEKAEEKEDNGAPAVAVGEEVAA